MSDGAPYSPMVAARSSMNLASALDLLRSNASVDKKKNASKVTLALKTLLHYEFDESLLAPLVFCTCLSSNARVRRQAAVRLRGAVLVFIVAVPHISVVTRLQCRFLVREAEFGGYRDAAGDVPPVLLKKRPY